MPATPANRLPRIALAAVLATGAGLFGLALGGMSGVDGALQAASAPPTARMVVHQVEDPSVLPADPRCARPDVAVRLAGPKV